MVTKPDIEGKGHLLLNIPVIRLSTWCAITTNKKEEEQETDTKC